MADAAILAWDRKYLSTVDLWRPETGIRQAATDNNPNTQADPNWQLLSTDRQGAHFSPNFSAFVSGHATFAYTWAAVMRHWFGRVPGQAAFPQLTVLLTSTTVTYDSGETVTGMIKTSLCVMGGDSGGPLYHGTVALGITSGGTDTSAPCRSGVSNRRSYFQSVQEALDSRGLSVY
jgi:hypothetical protein